jgi:hypothetical protein
MEMIGMHNRWYWKHLNEPRRSEMKEIIMRFCKEEELDKVQLQKLQLYIYEFTRPLIIPTSLEKRISKMDELTQKELQGFVADVLVGEYGIDPL